MQLQRDSADVTEAPVNQPKIWRVSKGAWPNLMSPLKTENILWLVTEEGKTVRVPGTSRRSNQSIPNEINPEYLLEGLMLKWKLQYFGHLMREESLLIRKDSDAGKDWRREVKGMTEDEVVGWHHQLNGYEVEQTPRDSEGQGNLGCCSPLRCRVRHDWAIEQQKALKPQEVKFF